MKKLERSELKSIFGGGIVIAECGGGTSVECSGTVCTATDNVGCSCDDDEVVQECPIA